MKPTLGIVNEIKKDGYTVLSIDTKQATYQGISWRKLGDTGKRKFENILILTRPQERLKIIYG